MIEPNPNKLSNQIIHALTMERRRVDISHLDMIDLVQKVRRLENENQLLRDRVAAMPKRTVTYSDLKEDYV